MYYNIKPRLFVIILRFFYETYASLMLLSDYLQNPVLHNFTFKPISEGITINILDSLKPKPSCGNDGISTKLLKAIKQEICKALTIIINQSLASGIFLTT